MFSRRGLPLPVLFAATLAACSGAPAPPPPTLHLDAVTPPTAALLPLAARWVESNGCTFVGPVLPGGTLVLLGGRRALVHADGSLETEKAPAPEPLCGLVEVPTAAGTRLVGHGAHGVYRFDDPLGAPVALARSQEQVARVGAGPSLVAVWTGASDLPRFLDVETGREQKLAGLPEPPLRALAFVDTKRGAGVFEAVGLAVTTDGGATWRLAAESVPFDALRASGLRRREGAVRAFAFADGPDGVVDLEGARLGASEPQRWLASEASILRWVRATGRDPLEAVASGGLDLPTGGALVASHGLLARVDPRSGAIEDLVEVAHGAWASPCGAGRSGRVAWVACTVPGGADQNLFDPFGVMRVPLGEPALTVDRPTLVRNGEAELRVSPSGGAMLLAACSNEEAGSACVRQPDGKWRTIALDLEGRGAGPLSDGRVAFLRGMFDGDDAPEPPAPAPASPGDDDGGPERRLHVAVVGPEGRERVLAPIGFTPSRGYVRVQSPVEEDADRTLRFVVEDGEGPFVVVVSPGPRLPARESVPARRVPDAVAARLHAGRGIAVGEGHVLASLDGGSTWSELVLTPREIEAANAAAASYEDPGQLAVSELGAKIGPILRIGWAPEGAAPAEPAPPEASSPPAPGPLLAPRPPAPTDPEQVLACSSQGPQAGTPPLNGSAQVRQLLGGKPVPAAAGARRETTSWSSGRAGMLDTIALLDEEGPDGKGAAPARWTFRWQDPAELGGRVRSVSLPAPAGATFGTSLRFAAASGGRALFALRSGGKLRLVHIKQAGSAEIVEVASELLPASEVAFGEGRSDAVAWLREAQVIVWLPGERPRAIARVGMHATRIVGAPTASGVPLLLGGSDWSLQRTLPIAASSEAPPSLEGWARLPPFLHRIEALPACGPRVSGARFTLVRSSLHAEVDGASEIAGQALYDVRLSGSDACIAGVTATLAPDNRPRPSAPPPSAPTPAAFVRADFTSKRAEGGERGLPPAAMRRMTCSLSPFNEGAASGPKPRAPSGP
jgi:hypothetical protein